MIPSGGMLSPRGYSPGYALMIASHRLLRYLLPFLHLLALAANIALVTVAPAGAARDLYLATTTFDLLGTHQEQALACSPPSAWSPPVAWRFNSVPRTKQKRNQQNQIGW